MPIDLLLRISLQLIGNLKNDARLAGTTANGSPEFFEALQLLGRLRLAGELSID